MNRYKLIATITRTKYNLQLHKHYHDITMDGWKEKEFSNQGTEELRSIIKDELGFDNKSILDDFTNHITVAGATFF